MRRTAGAGQAQRQACGMKRVLLLGGSGQLGRAIRHGWLQAELTSPGHAQLDICDARAFELALDASRPQIVVNCAAFHNVELCEREPERAFAANALALEAMGRACEARGTTFVTFSTDYVFDGTLGRAYRETDAPHPLNAYAISKRAGELLLERLQSRAYVVRTCGLYGTVVSPTKGHTFIARALAQARAGEPLRIVRDQTVSPTYAAHLADAVWKILDGNAPFGVYHLAGEGAVTWYDFACEALRQAGIDRPVEPISHHDWNSPVRRPEYSALENAKARALGVDLPGWREGIAAYLRDVGSGDER